MCASRLSIHDISRLPAAPGELPRFNMPFECGVSGPIRSISRVVTRSQLLINRLCLRRLAHTHNPLQCAPVTAQPGGDGLITHEFGILMP